MSYGVDMRAYVIHLAKIDDDLHDRLAVVHLPDDYNDHDATRVARILAALATEDDPELALETPAPPTILG